MRDIISGFEGVVRPGEMLRTSFILLLVSTYIRLTFSA